MSIEKNYGKNRERYLGQLKVGAAFCLVALSAVFGAKGALSDNQETQDSASLAIENAIENQMLFIL